MRLLFSTILLVFISCFSSSLLAQACTDADSGTLTVNPPIPSDGTNYPGGTVVQMCFTLNEFNTPSVNWLHSIIPTFGPGFDFNTFSVVSTPSSCAGTGNWAWYNSWTSCVSGDMFGPGFAFDGTQNIGCGGGPGVDGDPGNNYGDGGTLCANRTWCWNLTTVPVSPFSCAVLNYNTRINIYGDAETGNWLPAGGGQPCLNDDPLCVPGLENIMVTQDAAGCGCTTISAVWDGQLLGQNCGLDIQWTGPGGFSSNELENEVCTPGVYNLSIGVNDCVDYQLTANVVIVGNPPVVNLSANPSPVCQGDSITFSASDLGPGATYLWDIDGVEHAGQTVTVVATGGGGETAMFTGTDANGCFIEENLFYVVLPPPNAIIQLSDDMVCENETVTVRGIGPGMTGWDFDGATVNSGSGNGPYELAFPEPGIYTIAFSADNGTCDDTSYMDVTVFELYESPMVTCVNIGNDSILFTWNSAGMGVDYELVLDGGTPFVVSDTTFGVGQLPNGSNVTLDVVPVSNGVCPDPLPGTASCTVFSCPDATLAITPQDTSWCQFDPADPFQLTFTGTGFGTLIDTSWTGDFVVAGTDTLDVSTDVPGIFFTYLELTNEDGCIYRDTQEIVIIERVTGTIDVETPICVFETSTVSYVGTAPTDGSATFDWFFDGAIAVPLGNETYELTFPSPGTYDIHVDVTFNGCVCFREPQTIIVIDQLATPSPGCGGGGVDSVSFNWPAVSDATSYTYIINGGTPQTTTDTEIGVGGLMEGDAVTFQIFAEGLCGPSDTASVVCVAEACPDITLLIDDSVNEFCLGDTIDFIVLDIAQNSGSGTGTYTWSGPGVSNDTFYIADAGLGAHEIIVSYADGVCIYGDTTMFNVFDIPVADFSLSDSLVCTDEIITVTNEVAMLPGASYVYDFPGGTPASATDYGPHNISYAAAGTYIITLTVSQNGCSSVTTDTVVVEAPLVAPMIICDAVSQLQNITVDWNAVDPNTGYEVTVDGVVVDTVNTLTYTVNGLSPDTTLVFSVRALSDAACGDGPSSGAVFCSTAACPDITISPAAAQTEFCFDDGDPAVLLTATSSGGDMSGTFTWSGTGVVQNGTDFTFDPTLAGVGEHLLIVDYLETAGCTGQDSLLMSVYATPNASFTLSSDTICSTASTTVTYTGTTGTDVTIDWNFSGAIVTPLGNEVYDLNWTAAGTYTIQLTVTRNGCDSTISDEVVVFEPLAAIDVSCTQQTLTSVTFSWTAVVGATGYEVNVGGVLDTVNTLDFLIDTLSPGQMISITVVPLGDLPCGNGPGDTEDCSALDCPDIVVSAMADQTAFCLDGNAASVALTATSSGGDMSGTFTWSGNGVVDAGGVFTFDPVLAGIGDHDIVVDYVETAGCSGSDTITMNVFAIPTADFSLSADTICSTENTVVTYTGTATSLATYNWDFDGATVTDLGNEVYELTWPTAGTYTISLMVSEAGCSSNAMSNVVVFEPLADPVPTCDMTTITSVTFNWGAVAGATGYSVSIDGSLPIIIDSTTFTVADLDENTPVMLTLIALGADPCGNSTPVDISCTSEPCPNVTLTPSASQTAFCAGIDDELIDLNATVSGGSGNTVVWTGTGVESSLGGFVFNPNGLASGTYPLTVTYIESICTTSAVLNMVINDQPSSAFTLNAMEACTGSLVEVGIVGSPVAGATYNWNFDGATVTDLGNQTYQLSWATIGNHPVSLVVEANGCSSNFSDNVLISAPPTAGQQVQSVAVCQNSGEQINLFNLLQGTTAGGNWSPGPGSPAAVDPLTGVLNTNNLPAGTFEYIYTVAGGVCPDAMASVSILVEPAPEANAGISQTLTCRMGMVSLNGSGSSGSGDLVYLWTGPDGNPISLDADQPIVDVAAPGIYTLTVTSEIGCSASSTVEVFSETEVPVPQVEISNPSCFSAVDGTILVTSVDGGVPPYSYSLNGAGSVATTFFTGLNEGEYSLRVTDANGCFTEIFLGLSRPDELSVSITLPNDQNEYEEGERVTLTARIEGGSTIDTLVWTPDSLNQRGEGTSNTITFLADQTRTISVRVLDENGCSATDQTTILVRKDRAVYVPTAISPNGDNFNDVLYIGADPEKVELIQDFLIFNRWGESVFENYNFLPNEPAQGWDGTHRGETLNPEVFAYVAKVLFKNGDVVIYKGDITLLR